MPLTSSSTGDNQRMGEASAATRVMCEVRGMVRVSTCAPTLRKR